MKIELAPLPYSQEALEPYVSRNTLAVHYGKHHAKYVEMTNQLIAGTRYENMKLEEIIVESAKNKEDKKIFNNAAQAWNHTFYWSCMSPEKKAVPASGPLAQAIEKSFGSFAQFQEAYKKKAVEVFGSGWTWLVRNKEGGLEIVQTENAGCPLTSGQTPLLTCDVWEHAYYLDYKNERNTYFDNFWKVANWSFAESNLKS